MSKIDEKYIRERFTYQSTQWREIRDQANIDMRYISGDPWDPKERREREDNGRFCLSLDELNQYVNQLNNDVRQAKRTIKVVPKGQGATDATAELRMNKIREIEYKSNAQAAYSTAAENAFQRSYGYWRINTAFSDEEVDLENLTPAAFHQDIVIKRIPDPDTVYPDFDAKEYDTSDADDYFVLTQMTKAVFKRHYPKARIVDFTAEHSRIAQGWIRRKEVQVAEYWHVDRSESKEVWLVDMGANEDPKVILAEDGKGLDKKRVLMHRKIEIPKVCQYITNGVEVLDEKPWDGRYIPIVPVFGKEMYVDDGSGSRRILLSLIRLARDPYMLYCYLRTQEAEEAAMTPRSQVVGYEGQFEGHEDEWQMANRRPTAYLQVKPILAQLQQQEVLPLPERSQFQPNFQAYEIACESARRAIQSAVGMYNTSIGKHDTNAQSGKAIQELDSQSEQGTFHFIDNYERSLEYGGRIMNNLLGKVYDTARDIAVRNAKGEHDVIHINEPREDTKTGEMVHNQMDKGEHDVTIQTGPSFQSQRDEANAFVEKFIGEVARLNGILPPQTIAQLIGYSIKLKDLGPFGEEIFKLLVPDPNQQIPAGAQQQIQQLQQRLQLALTYAQKLEQDKKANLIKIQGQLLGKQMDNETRIEVAEIMTKAQDEQQRTSLLVDLLQQFHSQAHEAGMQAADQAHAQGMAAMQPPPGAQPPTAGAPAQ